MPASGRFFFTPHAVRQYIRRYRRHYTYDQALTELIAITQDARYVRPAKGGAEFWRTGRPLKMPLIVRRAERPDALPVVITIPCHGHTQEREVAHARA